MIVLTQNSQSSPCSLSKTYTTRLINIFGTPHIITHLKLANYNIFPQTIMFYSNPPQPFAKKGFVESFNPT